MTRRELLQEQYEDALFALLMDALVISEGQKALEENERLKYDPQAGVPNELDRRCEKAIRKGFSKRAARDMGHFTFRSLKKVVMVAGLAAILFTTVFATSETARTNTVNLVIEMYGKHAEFMFSGQSSGLDREKMLEIEWLPDGYELVKQGSDPFGVWYEYRNTEEGYICVSLDRTANTVMSVNTEGAEISELEVNNVKGTWIKTEKILHLVLITDDHETVVDLYTEGVSEKDFLHIATRLKYSQ